MTEGEKKQAEAKFLERYDAMAKELRMTSIMQFRKQLNEPENIIYSYEVIAAINHKLNLNGYVNSAIYGMYDNICEMNDVRDKLFKPRI